MLAAMSTDVVPMQLITTSDDVARFCRELADDTYVTVDTEFMRDRTYYPRLCLLQLGGAEHVAAIDPLAEGIDMAPVLELMANTDILKVFHAPRQDLEIFHRLGQLPRPIFHPEPSGCSTTRSSSS